jgi:GxxExxY protein
MLYSEITGEIIGASMEVHRAMGRGFQEYIYQRALERELKKRRLSVRPEFDLPVYYKNEQIGLRKVDFLVNDLICVEIKAVVDLDDAHLAQALNYWKHLEKKWACLLILAHPRYNSNVFK